MLLLLLLATIGCRFDYRAPRGARSEDAALQRAATSFYSSLTHHDTAAFGKVVFPAATILINGGGDSALLVPARALLDVPEHRTERKGVRLIRSEVRADGDLATARMIIAVEGTTGLGEFEASDFLTLARRNGTWRLAHAVLGPWRPRSAP